jgi:hypothetical protein
MLQTEGATCGHVCDEMVHVVRAFPPPDGETAAKVGDEGADQSIGDEIAGYAPVASIVGGEHDLLLYALKSRQLLTGPTYPKHAQANGRCQIPFGVEEEDKQAEEKGPADCVLCVF